MARLQHKNSVCVCMCVRHCVTIMTGIANKSGDLGTVNPIASECDEQVRARSQAFRHQSGVELHDVEFASILIVYLCICIRFYIPTDACMHTHMHAHICTYGRY